ncbi:MAG: YlxR family protein [Deltaproteobacteria bacterium]|nr:YlxR family protein [Deltaproteobacteria bacterium]
MRTCVGCRRVAAKSGLVRFAAPDGVLKPDIKGRLPGRGAYVCRSEACLAEALRKKDAFARALRRKVSAPPAEELEEALKTVFRDREP